MKFIKRPKEQDSLQLKDFFDQVSLIYSSYFDLSRRSGTTFNFNRRLQLVAKLATPCSGSMLDCASGDGTITACALQVGNFHRATLVDLSASMLQLTQQTCNPLVQGKQLTLQYYNMDIVEFLKVEPPQETYDLIICSGLIAHIDNSEELLKLLQKRLSISGKIILQTTLLDNFVIRLVRVLTAETFFQRNGYYIKYYTTQDIQRLCQCSGLKVDSVERFSVGMQFLDRFLPPTWNYTIENHLISFAKLMGSEALYLLSRSS